MKERSIEAVSKAMVAFAFVIFLRHFEAQGRGQTSIPGSELEVHAPEAEC